MREWLFKSFRPVNPVERFPIFRRFPIRRAAPFIGSESAALAFARGACTHLNVVRVEAWTPGHSEPSDLPHSITFRLLPIGNKWRAEQNVLHHGGIWGDLDGELDYALWRGSGKLCRIEVLNVAGCVAWLVLSGKGPTWEKPTT